MLRVVRPILHCHLFPGHYVNSLLHIRNGTSGPDLQALVLTKCDLAGDL